MILAPRVRSSWLRQRTLATAERRPYGCVVLDFIGYAASAWGVAMAVAPLLQVRRIIVRRSAADVSVPYLLVLQMGFGLWIAYGIVAGNGLLAIPNTIAFGTGLVTIIVARSFREPSA